MSAKETMPKIPHTIGQAVYDALEEMHKQDTRWGADRQQPNHVWRSILGEEMGEVDTELYDMYAGVHSLPELREELVQVAAVTLQWIEAIDRGDQ